MVTDTLIILRTLEGRYINVELNVLCINDPFAVFG